MSLVTDNLLSILIAISIVLLYLLVKRRLAYFSSRGLPYVQPSVLETIKSISVMSFVKIIPHTYQRQRDCGSPFIGVFHTLLYPTIIVLDPALAEKILIKDFSHFIDHGMELDVADDPLAKHLFHLRGDEWRTLRHKLLPTFTSGKLKGMVPTMDLCAQAIVLELKENAQLREEASLKQIFRRYTLSVIATCVFGIDLESIKDPNCDFRVILKKALTSSFIMYLRLFMIMAFPKIGALLGLKVFTQEIEDYYIKLTKDALELRKSSGAKRNDFVQLLLELREKGSVEMDVRDLEEDEKMNIQQSASETINNKLEITDELLSSQMMQFIVGGYDNTAYLVSVTNYMLSKHKDIQQRVREEVREAKRKHGGMNYQALRDMKLLEASINESLRISPPLFFLGRECTKTYSLDNGMSIEKGMKLFIPMKEFQNDKLYWDEPEKFDPERFINSDITPGTYLPFGDGPRLCIAQRMALLMGKIILTQLVENFELLPSNKTKEPIEMELDISPDIVGGFWGKFKPLSE